MGHENDPAPGQPGSQVGRRRNDSLACLGQRLRGERQVGGVLQVGLQLTREHLGEALQGGAGPPHPQAPFGEALVHLERSAAPLGDQRGGLAGPLQR